MKNEQLLQALGEAAIEAWVRRPMQYQRLLFEEFITKHGEEMRHDLAKLLHERHPRTAADPLSKMATEIPEPDSLGG